jgi:prepilin-type N-terminal cleavage/methylation domain-containing protein
MKQNNHGFTLVEMVVVLVLISIISATVLARSISTNQIDFVGQVDKIRNHIRYAQSMAMKRNEIWGIKSNATQYWLFTWVNPGDENNPATLPGEDTGQINLSGLGVTMNAFTVYFVDGLGVPYKSYQADVPVRPDNRLIITITAASDGSLSRNLEITPETGLITTQ